MSDVDSQEDPPVNAGAEPKKTGRGIVMNAPHTTTSREQWKTEEDVILCFKAFMGAATAGSKTTDDGASIQQGIRLDRDRHSDWLKQGLLELPTSFAGLDASRPWFVFWISHALEMLDSFDESSWAPQVASFLGKCQGPAGGFAGGPMQLPHLAPTYAATAALIIAGSEDAYKVPDRSKLYNFLMRMKHPEGGFRMHEEGETDMRGTYCAIAVASMLHMITDELIEGVPEYVARCQTFEGGIAGEQGLEAHGGYSYCGLAALCILGKANVLDLHALLNWASHRQMSMEGGFCGRTNKLVDSCYSFWQGAIFPLIHEAFRQQGAAAPPLPEGHLWFRPEPLQTYVFLACQHKKGGLKDKPGKSADFYHTCYSLSGVAATQYGLNKELVLGSDHNQLTEIDVYYNVGREKVKRKREYFSALPPFEGINGEEVHGVEGVGIVESSLSSLAFSSASRS
eukprot:TRINITY_DN46238_c0_g1_i1.p1 TRINITY_DN46238_c0_g1~~TRINITY_DN46238_c0_g1_i1.p1  ORF type:complete len:454 (+),score=78.50 TRINITY_DN46238_c0_g1_i1:144-1505(+)